MVPYYTSLRRRAALFLIVGLVALPYLSAADSGRDDKLADLEAFVHKQMTENAVPGIAIGIFNDGYRYTQGFGVTNIDHPLTVNDETLFQVGSITKTMTGTILMLSLIHI